MAYGKFTSSAVAQSNPILHLSVLEVASPQAYGLFGIGATHAGVCQTRRKVIGKTKKLKQGNTSSIHQPEVLSPTANGISSSGASTERTSNASDLCEIESSLCIHGSDTDTEQSEKRIIVSEAMRTKYMTVLMDTLLADAVSLMLAEKQPCAHDCR